MRENDEYKCEAEDGDRKKCYGLHNVINKQWYFVFKFFLGMSLAKGEV